MIKTFCGIPLNVENFASEGVCAMTKSAEI